MEDVFKVGRRETLCGTIEKFRKDINRPAEELLGTRNKEFVASEHKGREERRRGVGVLKEERQRRKRGRHMTDRQTDRKRGKFCVFANFKEKQRTRSIQDKLLVISGIFISLLYPGNITFRVISRI